MPLLHVNWINVTAFSMAFLPFWLESSIQRRAWSPAPTPASILPLISSSSIGCHTLTASASNYASQSAA